MIYRDIVFSPYSGLGGGWQAIIDCKFGKVSVRYGGDGLFTSEDKPFECRYNGDVWPDQDEKDVYHFIKTGKILSREDAEARMAGRDIDSAVSMLSDIVKKFKIPPHKLSGSFGIGEDD
ncbi:MAG: hypothetical protein IPJ00_17315 [Saprospirales bacterium]|nr:hypothetical protein [Saprospirales bacterium]